MEKAIVYMVAGMSSRFEGKIKSFVDVGKNGETLMEISLNQALKAGFNKIVFIVGNKTELPFKEKFGNEYNGVPVFYAHQKFDENLRDKPWGTADAICALRRVIDCPFVICNGDELFGENALQKMYGALESGEEGALGYPLGDMVPNEGKVNRGIFSVKEGYVEKIEEMFNVEKKKMKELGLKNDDLCNVNVFALHQRILDLLCERVKRFKEEHEGDRKIECLLPTEISELILEEKIRMKMFTTTDKWIGVTNPGDEVAVKKFLANQRS